MIQAVKWENEKLVLLDQRLLPQRMEFVSCGDFREIAKAISDMVVRGAPAIGIAGGYAVAAAVRESVIWAHDVSGRKSFLKSACETISGARPTAVNLKWAVDRVLNKTFEALEHTESSADVDGAYAVALSEANIIAKEDVEMNQKIGAYGAHLIRAGSRALTHCNAGALATGGYGTALGVVRKAWAEKKISMVYVDETRPYLQGARLTAWELLQDGIHVTVLVDSAAGYLISKGMVDFVIVGADRIARNGDVANKIGTYTLACLAHIHHIPFYVAAPTSTFDLSIPDRSAILVEERAPEEVLCFRGKWVAPQGAKALNPAFDLTPSRLVSAIITEKGVILPPIWENLPKIVSGDHGNA